MVVSILPGFAQTSSIDITGNLVNNTQTANSVTSTWQNAVFQNSLTCWAAGDPGYCGPNPIVRPSGDINFSYGLANLHQKVNVANALASTGLVTTGFKFEWTSKNGNGWDDGRLDTLSAYVKLYSSGDSKIIENFNYNLNTIHNWTSYSWNENWANTKIGYRGNQVGNVQFGFVGMDNNYWAGPYGPEVTNVSFQLKYKPDPCKNNPLYSPECPNFQDQLAKMTATPKTETSPVIYEDTQTQQYKEEKPPKNEFEDGSKEFDANEHYVDLERLSDTLVKVFDNQVRQEEQVMEIAKEELSKTLEQSEKITKFAESIAKESQNKSIKDSIEIKAETINISSSKKESNDSTFSIFQGPNTSGGTINLSLISPRSVSLNQVQQKENKDSVTSESQVIVSRTPSQIQQQSMLVLSAFTKAQEQIQDNKQINNTSTQISLIGNLSAPVNKNIIQNNTSVSVQQPTEVSTQNLNITLPNNPTTQTTVTNQPYNSTINLLQPNFTVSQPKIQSTYVEQTYQISTSTILTESNSSKQSDQIVVSSVNQVNNIQPQMENIIPSASFFVEKPSVNTDFIIKEQIVEQEVINPMITTETKSKETAIEMPAISNNILLDRSSPLNEIITSKPVVTEEQKQEVKTTGTKQNVKDNEIAGGVSIGNIARSPIGFNSYMVALNDANFYKPKEIYRNQKTVDNVRVLRQLASDRLHQEMVDQQYRR